MGLAQALATSVSGLRTTQAGLSLIASNVANAQTPGYIRKTLSQTTTSAGGVGVSVRTDGINRELDRYLQQQLRVETSGGAYADLRAQFYSRLQAVYGTPGSDSTLETVFNKFNTALQALSTSPDDVSARNAVLSAAQVLAQQLNGMTADIQGLRSDAEQGLADAVTSANNAMAQIAAINRQLATSTANDAASATLLDQRDAYIDQLSQLMDIRVVAGQNNQINIFTNSGIQLVGTQASQLAFNATGMVTAGAQWNADPAKSGVGTLTLVSPNGGAIDLIANNSIRSGQIAAYLEMRDDILVGAQNQLDAFAAGLASALSDRTVSGTPVNPIPQSGFDVDVGGLLAGNSINLTYADMPSGTQHRITIVRVDDPAALPLSNAATNDPNDEVVGIDFSGGLASVAAQLNSRFNGRVQFSVSGATIQILNDAPANTTSILAASTTQTVTSLSGGTGELPFFTDGAQFYSGAITSSGSEKAGFAGRITVNAALLGDPSRLVAYQGGTAAGDATRPDFIYNQLNNASLYYAPDTGIGSVASPFSGSLKSFLKQALSQQGENASNASSLAQGQAVVVNALQQRFDDASKVNIDEEMANLLQLQTAYGANARVMSTVRDMLDTLMKI
ncbi:MAG: flagellar hook-associated protein FlgK [Pseudorhodoplanes sp.]